MVRPSVPVGSGDLGCDRGEAIDPEFVTHADWSNIGGLLRFLWLFPLFVIGVTGNVLLAQAVIPSLVATHHLPEEALRLRPLLLGAAAGALALVIVVLVVIIGRAAVIADIYERWWI